LTNSRWRRIFAKMEFAVFVTNIVYELGYIRTTSCNRCGYVTRFESESSSLGLPYNEGGTTRCNL
jgi:hypothetical protein